MNLQKILIELRVDETVNAAAKRIGISETYLRSLESGYDRRRQTAVKPSAEVLRKIAKAYKVDFNILAKAAGLPVEIEENDFIPFETNPTLNRWYKELPQQDEQIVMQLYQIWNILKGVSK